MLWLVRTRDHVIVGPYSKEQICNLIHLGELEPHDEVCPSAGYWFSLFELDEVKKQLGIIPPPHFHRARGEHGEEITETLTETLTDAQSGTVVARPINPSSKVEVHRPPVERPTFFKSVAILLAFGAIGLLYFLFRLLASA